MATCFVIQPFDKGKFDKRYEDVFDPAIRKAGLEPYRVDRDPSTTIPIEDIQEGIERAEACLVDISTDNPNVWFELGYAIAIGRNVVLVCSTERVSPFPFDVQHRSIIRYATESPRDFSELGEKIVSRIKALRDKSSKMGTVARLTATSSIEGLEAHELGALVSIAQKLDDPNDAIAVYAIRLDMENAGFTDLATTLALRSLVGKGMIELRMTHDYNGEEQKAYGATEVGMAWLAQNVDKLVLKRPSRFHPGDDETPF